MVARGFLDYISSSTCTALQAIFDLITHPDLLLFSHVVTINKTFCSHRWQNGFKSANWVMFQFDLSQTVRSLCF